MPVLRSLIVTIMLIAVVGCSPTSSKQGSNLPAKPNIVFIMVDDQSTDLLGYMEGKALTPNIDTLAREGLQFDRSYVASSVCSPSRYTVLSGQYASRSQSHSFIKQTSVEGVNRVLWNVGYTDEQITLPKALQSGGYKTGFVGKWHINEMQSWRPLPVNSDPASPEVIAHLKQNQAGFSKEIQSFGFDFAKNIYSGNPWDDKALRNTGMNIHNQEWLTQAGLEFIESHQNEPFFLYFSTTLNHVPDNYASLSGDPRTSPIGILPEPIMGVQPSRESVLERCREAGIENKRCGATWLDDGIGALLNKLDELKLRENTLVIYFVDHGMSTTSKGTCYEGGLITPTFANWPGVIQPDSTRALIQNIDFAPTILELAGIAPPQSMVIDGTSFVPALTGEHFEGHESVYSEIGLTRAVTTADGWKYIAFKVPESMQRTQAKRLEEHKEALKKMNAGSSWQWDLDPEARYYQMGMAAGGTSFERWQHRNGGPWKPNYFDSDQLYNLNVDPEESNNLANDPKYTAKLAEMQEKLKVYLNRLPGTYPELKPQ